MTSAEFQAARLRLGWSREQAAAEYRLTPQMVDGIEEGTLAVPRDAARDLLWRAAVAEHLAILEASGLPGCEVAEEMDRRAAHTKGQALLDALQALDRHAQACDLCRARSAYLEEHAPPLPEMPMHGSARIFGAVNDAMERLPAPIRPPPYPEGEYRRLGIFLASYLSMIATAIMLIAVIAGIVRGGAFWQEIRVLRELLLIVACYFVGFYVAGAVFDRTRRIAHRFRGYVLRGSLGLALVYGVFGLVMPLFDSSFRWTMFPVFVLGFGVLGALVAAGKWAFDRLRGRLPSRAA